MPVHEDDQQIGAGFSRLRYSAKTGAARDQEQREAAEERQERTRRRQERQEQREAEEAEETRREQIKRTAYAEHGRILSDEEADEVAAEGLDGGSQERDEGDVQQATRIGAERTAQRYVPASLVK